MEEEISKRLELNKILEETHAVSKECLFRILLLEADLDDIIKRLQEGLKNNDKRIISTAIKDLKTLKTYVNRFLYGRALHLEINIAQAGLKNAEIMQDKAKSEKQ